MAKASEQTVWACPWWRVDEEHVTGADGVPRRWYSARRANPETVHILGITPAGLVPVLRQWRFPVGAWVWELPAGICDRADEPIEQTARRELLEETGYAVGELQLVFRGTVSPGLTNEIYNAYLGFDLIQVEPGGGTGGEQIEVHHVHVHGLFEFALDAWRRGDLIDSKILAHAALVEPSLLALPERRDWWIALSREYNVQTTEND